MANESTPAADVVYFDTEESASLFDGADVKGHFWTLCRYFVAEEFLTYCGIASAVTVLNSLRVPSPEVPQIHPYKLFTQDNLFTEDVLEIRRPLDVEQKGSTLDQLASILAVFEVEVETVHADSLDVDSCRDLLVRALRSPAKRVIVDFDRKTLGQQGGGHFSPLAAYNSQADRFLLMDVADTSFRRAG